jgi:hypothetical protein
MYCLRRYGDCDPAGLGEQKLTFHSYIPLLLLPLPLSLSAIHLTILLVLTYILNRPCVYCSFLLIILFASSCHWSGRCFVDFTVTRVEEGGYGYSAWFLPRLYASTPTSIESQHDSSAIQYFAEVANGTVTALAGAMYDSVKDRLMTARPDLKPAIPSTAGVGLGWIRRLLGRLGVWDIPCLGVKLRL